ncbi:MAG: hypothetical protein ACE5HK_07295 [Candidatus Methylomirabilales bacterium]
MNGDGIVTISDVLAWPGWLFYYPGDLVIYHLLKIGWLAEFLELTSGHYGGWLSLVISVMLWWIAVKGIMKIFNKVILNE